MHAVPSPRAILRLEAKLQVSLLPPARSVCEFSAILPFLDHVEGEESLALMRLALTCLGRHVLMPFWAVVARLVSTRTSRCSLMGFWAAAARLTWIG